MEQNKNQSHTQDTNQKQGFFAEPRIILSKDGQYILHFLPGNMIVRKHVNLYKKILGVAFEPKVAMGNAA